jgi:hypothetical protein
MAVSNSIRFNAPMTKEAAQRVLDGSKSLDSVSDRIAAGRRLLPVTTALERATSRAMNRQREREIAKYGSVEAYRAALALQAIGSR